MPRPEPALPSREVAYGRLRDLRAKFAVPSQKLYEFNEATTRLLVVDEILQCIGWSKDQFNPEVHSAAAGYTDYLLSIDDEPRVVVEAKKAGKTFFSNKRHAKNEYPLSYARSAFGQEFTDVLEQAERYAKQHKVPFAALTNGGEWVVVQLVPSPGQAVEDLRCFYVGNLLTDHSNFDLFWGLLSQNAVLEGALAEQFSQVNVLASEFTAVPRAELGELVWRKACTPELRVEEFYRTFFDEILDPAREAMLRHCFVSSSKLDQYEGSLKRVLRDTAPKYIDAANDLSPGDHEELLAKNVGDRTGRVVLIAGSVGCGKSTFVTKVLVGVREQQNVQAILVDLIDEHEPVDPTGLLWRRVFEQWRRSVPDSQRYAELKKIFRTQVKQLKRGPKEKIFASDPGAYDAAEGEMLQRLADDPEQFLQACWRYYAGEKGIGVVVFLDNVDRGSEPFQRDVYNFAHRIARLTGATVLITMREATYFRGKAHDFLDVRSSDVVYHLQAPDPVQVVARRIRYVEELSREDHRYENLKADLPLFQQHAALVKLRLLGTEDNKSLIQILSALAWHDIRAFLASLRQVHVALGGNAAWSVANVLAAFMTSRDSTGMSQIPNLYQPPESAYPCLFVRSRILASLLYAPRAEQLRQGIHLSPLLQFLRNFGYHDPWSRRAVEELVRERLVECLEAPAAAEYSQAYRIEAHHSFRPSPLGLVLFEKLQQEPIYMALIGAQITYHSQKAYAGYLKTARELLAAVGGTTIDPDSAALFAESDAPRLVGAYLGEAFKREQPVADVARYHADAFAVESRLKNALDMLTGFAAGKAGKSDAPPPLVEPQAKQLELELADPSGTGFGAPPEPTFPPCPSCVREIRIGGSTLAPAVFWALILMRLQGRRDATGAEITRVMNEHIFSDQEQKEPTNVSRALRQPTLRSQAWLLVDGVEHHWRYALSADWREAWLSIFGSPAPAGPQ